ncbi:hypothetical protein Syun_004408 [Stephania yunnanensis]|uniref:Uncharacterized protein n=1 Tax=Stephania yunnanensis TaxID=152371 RepID=A0AAP0L345_9MAGN
MNSSLHRRRQLLFSQASSTLSLSPSTERAEIRASGSHGAGFGGFVLIVLVEQGKMEEERRNLERLRGTKNVDAKFADLVEASVAARAVKHPFRNLLKRRNQPPFIIEALGIPAFRQLTGMNSILFYTLVIFQSLGFGSDASLYSSLMTSSMLVLATIVSMFLVDKLGRRFFLLQVGVRMISCNLMQLVVVTILALKYGHEEALSKGPAVALVFSTYDLRFSTILSLCFSYQLYCEKERLREDQFELLKMLVDIGDILGACGSIKMTEKGE